MGQYTTTTVQAVQIQLKTDVGYEQVVGRLLALLGDSAVNLEDVAHRNLDWKTYREAVARLQGPSGFMLFELIDHGSWLSKAGIHQPALRVMFGNPIIALTILRHRVGAGLFVPLECLLLGEGDGSSITYIRPSSLIAPDGPAELLEAAQILDRKVEHLFSQVIKS